MVSEIQGVDFHQLSLAAKDHNTQSLREVRANSRIQANGSNNRKDGGSCIGWLLNPAHFACRPRTYRSSVETSPRTIAAGKTAFQLGGYPVFAEGSIN
jgi:hypothetical protein